MLRTLKQNPVYVVAHVPTCPSALALGGSDGDLVSGKQEEGAVGPDQAAANQVAYLLLKLHRRLVQQHLA
jgi:hypothetical protein